VCVVLKVKTVVAAEAVSQLVGGLTSQLKEKEVRHRIGLLSFSRFYSCLQTMWSVARHTLYLCPLRTVLDAVGEERWCPAILRARVCAAAGRVCVGVAVRCWLAMGVFSRASGGARGRVGAAAVGRGRGYSDAGAPDARRGSTQAAPGARGGGRGMRKRFLEIDMGEIDRGQRHEIDR
jgi:hypothetical protein